MMTMMEARALVEAEAELEAARDARWVAALEAAAVAEVAEETVAKAWAAVDSALGEQNVEEALNARHVAQDALEERAKTQRKVFHATRIVALREVEAEAAADALWDAAAAVVEEREPEMEWDAAALASSEANAAWAKAKEELGAALEVAARTAG